MRRARVTPCPRAAGTARPSIWEHAPGKFDVMVGSSSEDIRLVGTFEVTVP